MEKGKIPWQKKWICRTLCLETPKNAITNKTYNGTNRFILSLMSIIKKL